MYFIKVVMIFIYYMLWKKWIDVKNLVFGFIIVKNVMNMIKKELCFEYFDMIIIVNVRIKFFIEFFGIFWIL